jgi:tetratricopeptide (TPR) repeat protein
MVEKLEKRLAAQPNDAEGWARLGRSYVVMERKDKALAAYAKAHELAPDNVAVLSDYAWLVFNENPGITTGLVETLQSPLQAVPAHPDALCLAVRPIRGRYQGTGLAVTWLLPAEDPGHEHWRYYQRARLGRTPCGLPVIRSFPDENRRATGYLFGVVALAGCAAPSRVPQ